MRIPFKQLQLPLVWSLACAFGLLACRMDRQSTWRSSESLREAVAPTLAGERVTTITVQGMDSITAGHRAAKALRGVPSVVEVQTSTLDSKALVTSEGSVSPAALLSALTSVGLQGSIAYSTAQLGAQPRSLSRSWTAGPTEGPIPAGGSGPPAVSRACRTETARQGAVVVSRGSGYCPA